MVQEAVPQEIPQPHPPPQLGDCAGGGVPETAAHIHTVDSGTMLFGAETSSKRVPGPRQGALPSPLPLTLAPAGLLPSSPAALCPQGG